MNFSSKEITVMICCTIASLAFAIAAEQSTKVLYKALLAKECVRAGKHYTESVRGTPSCEEQLICPKSKKPLDPSGEK